MSLPDLRRRDPDLQELMDDPDCDPVGLRNTFAQFRYLNRMVAGWRGVYHRFIRPLLASDRGTTLLDVGCGGGDVARWLAGWAMRDGLRLDITAVDPDPRALAYAAALPEVRGVRFQQATSADLVGAGSEFDVVVSNHVLHHLDPAALDQLLHDSTVLARRLVVHNDLLRSRLAYAAYAVASRPFAGSSFVHTDGLRSIRRSYRQTELAALAGVGWRVQRQFPARLLLLHGSHVSRTGSTSAARSESIGA